MCIHSNMSIASCRPDAYETTHMKQQNENSKREQQDYARHKKAVILLQHFYKRTILIATTLLWKNNLQVNILFTNKKNIKKKCIWERIDAWNMDAYENAYIYHILNMSIASCRPDAYETTHITHISGTLLKEYINNVSNDNNFKK